MNLSDINIYASNVLRTRGESDLTIYLNEHDYNDLTLDFNFRMNYGTPSAGSTLEVYTTCGLIKINPHPKVRNNEIIESDYINKYIFDKEFNNKFDEWLNE